MASQPADNESPVSSGPQVRRYELLAVCSHPVQYASPFFRRMATHPTLTVYVAYCSLQGAEAGIDEDFGCEVKWDVPLLEGYSWTQLPNRAIRPGLNRFWGLLNPKLWRVVRERRPDAVMLYTGYRYASFWIALAAARTRGIPVFFGTDASQMQTRDGSIWKLRVKRLLWPLLFRLADIVALPSTKSVEMMKSLGIPGERIVLTPYAVDNDWWTENSGHVDRVAVRRRWGIPGDASVALFCAKLQIWKRPQDLLRAFAACGAANGYLVFAGDGALRADLEAEAKALGIVDRVRFLGFTNQSQLPEVYCASDLMILPSEYEPFGVVVNESMLCGCPVAVSDRVGAGYDLIIPGETGFVFPAGDVNALAAILRDNLQDRQKLSCLGKAAQIRMRQWSYAEGLEVLSKAVAALAAEK